MSTSNSPIFGNLDELDTPEFEYAIYFPEGSGYLWVDDLGAGVDGVAQIVWSCEEAAREEKLRNDLIAVHNKHGQESDSIEADDGLVAKHFVRKKTRPDWPSPLELDLKRFPIHLAEIRNFREHPRIPAMIDWTEYKLRPREDRYHLHHLSVSMIFKFCNGSTLDNLLRQYQEYYWFTNRLQGQDVAAAIAIPEAFIWKVFGQVLQVSNWIRHSRPGVSHNDIHLGNVFLHFDERTDTLPDCYLGDFGRSFVMYSGAWDTNGVPSYAAADPKMLEYDLLVLMLRELMVLKNSSETAGGEAAIESDFATNARSSRNYSKLLYDQIQLFDSKVQECKLTKENPDFSIMAKHIINMGNSMNGLRPQSLRNISRHYPSGPRTYKSANELVMTHKLESVAGPWKVAKIRAKDKAVVELSREVFQSFFPEDRSTEGPPYLVRSESDPSIPASERDVSLERM